MFDTPYPAAQAGPAGPESLPYAGAGSGDASLFTSELSSDGIHPEILLSQERYESYSSTQSTWSYQASEDLEFYFGVHWTEEQVKVLLERGQKPICINTTYQIVQQAVAMLTANDPSFRATAREDSDVRTASVVSDLLAWIWTHSRGTRRLKAAVTDFYVQGRGVLYVYIDPNKDFGRGDICISSLDPKDVFPDPNSTDPLWDDAADIIVRRIMTESQILALWQGVDLSRAQPMQGWSYGPTKRHAGQDQQLFPSDIGDVLHEKYEVLERFSKVKRPHFRLAMPDGDEEILSQAEYEQRLQAPAFVVMRQGQREVVTQPDQVQQLDGLYGSVGPVFHLAQPEAELYEMTGEAATMPPQPMPGPEQGAPGEVPGSTTELYPILVADLVQHGEIPVARFLLDRIRVVGSVGGVFLYKPYELPTSHYPVVPLSNNHQRNPFTVSDVRLIKDLQEAINKTNSLILAHAANSTNLKVFVPRGGTDKDQLEQEWGKAGAAFLEYDPALGLGERGGITIAAPPALPAALYANMDRFITLMQQILGVFSMQQGDTQAAPQTYNGTLALDEYGMRRIKSKMADIYDSLQRVGEVSIELAQKVYTRRRVLRLVNPNMPPKEFVINHLEYDDFGDVAQRINDITVGYYDVQIVGGSTLPSNRWARLQAYMELFKLGVADDVAVLQHSELPDADAILRRKGVMQQMQQALEQQADTIKNLEGDLQTWQREALHAKQGEEMARFKAKLSEIHNALAKAAQVYELSLQKDVEKERALMQLQRQNAAQAA